MNERQREHSLPSRKVDSWKTKADETKIEEKEPENLTYRKLRRITYKYNKNKSGKQQKRQKKSNNLENYDE